jgi:tetratricopeptide (TPR) repeat protein
VLRLNPNSAEAHNNLGLALAKIPGRLNEAIVEYKEALRLEPGYAAGWHNLGACWFHLGNLPEAAAAFREELRLAPDDPAARKAIDTVLAQSGEH